jgi:transposase
MTQKKSDFELDSKTVGALPIVNRFLDRLKFRTLFEKYLPPPDPRAKVPPIDSLEVLVRNVIVCRMPLYSVGEWARGIVPRLLGTGPSRIEMDSGINDDRMGRALDRLFDADRSALLTEFVVHMVREFDVDLAQFHNDSTSLTLQGQYKEADGRRIRGKRTLRVLFGHSKEHRPDLKQLLWILTVSADGAVPVHFKVADGNTEDSTSHIETWHMLCALVGGADFIYVADCKLCTRENLLYITVRGGHFITIMPCTRKEDAQFKAWLKTHTPEWQEIGRFPNPRCANSPPDVMSTMESPIQDADGFRLIWYHSSLKHERDAEARGAAIERAIKDLEELKVKLEGPRSRYSTLANVTSAADQIVAASGAAAWIRHTVSEWEQESFRQEKRGRPGNDTRWRRKTKARFRLTWELNEDAINADARTDGVFPLLTDRRDLSALQVLNAYKSKQPLIEKRHALLKSTLAVTPAFLKNVSRLEAYLLIHYIAVTVHALIERELRAAMRRQKVKELPLYPESRECKAPTTTRIIDVFESLQRHLLFSRGQHVQTFGPELSQLHETILQLLGLAPTAYHAAWR